jgi:hypothetical protein
MSDTTQDFVKGALDEGKDNDEIKRLAKLSPIAFDREREAAAKKLGVRIGTLEFLVKAVRDSATKQQKDFLPHWKVEPWSESVDGADLLEGLRKHFLRHVVLPKHTDVLLALWTLHTWVFDCFDITPYLAITSPTRRCGKTLLMTMLYWLCCRAKKNDSMSKAAIYRSVERDKPTLCLDEVGWVVDLRDERQNILCGGFERLGHAEVCEGEGADLAPRSFSTFCPKAFGLIGKLTATLMDRAIEIAMQRKLGEKVERLRRRDNADHARFRQQCLRWADDNREALAAIELKLPEGLNDRAFDAWEPLLAIAERAGGEWPKLAREAAIALSGGDPNTEEKSVELLGHIKVEFSKIEFPAMTTKALIDALCSDKERPWATWNKNEKPITDRQMARLLSEFRMIISETVHPNETGEVKDAKGYKRARFDDAFDRYLTPANEASRAQTGGQQASKRTNADEMGTTSDFCVRPESDQDGYEKREKPANDGNLYARTDKNPQPPREGNSGNGAGQFRSDVEDAYAELRARGEAARDDTPDIPAALWRGEVCAHCGQPVIGEPWDYDGIKVRLHDRCQYPWIDAYEASRNGATAVMASSA